MKQCPSCRTNYTDDSLQFCLQDGTALIENVASIPEINSYDDAPTVISPRQVEPIRIDVPDSQWQSWEETKQGNVPPPVEPALVQPALVQPIQNEPAPAKSGTTSTVLLTVLGMLALLAIAGIGGWLYLNNKKPEVAASVNTNTSNSRAANANATNNRESNANLAAPPQTPKPTPVPKATLDPEQAQTVTDDVETLVDDWKAASENLDLEAHLSQYAPTVDYYKGGKTSLAKVRADKERAYNQFDSITFNITNMKITPDASGEKATAIFDKQWTFEGANKNSTGKVQQLLTLSKIDGQWKIIGEKDLKVYYLE